MEIEELYHENRQTSILFYFYDIIDFKQIEFQGIAYDIKIEVNKDNERYFALKNIKPNKNTKGFFSSIIKLIKGEYEVSSYIVEIYIGYQNIIHVFGKYIKYGISLKYLSFAIPNKIETLNIKFDNKDHIIKHPDEFNLNYRRRFVALNIPFDNSLLKPEEIKPNVFNYKVCERIYKGEMNIRTVHETKLEKDESYLDFPQSLQKVLNSLPEFKNDVELKAFTENIINDILKNRNNDLITELENNKDYFSSHIEKFKVIQDWENIKYFYLFYFANLYNIVKVCIEKSILSIYQINVKLIHFYHIFNILKNQNILSIKEKIAYMRTTGNLIFNTIQDSGSIEWIEFLDIEHSKNPYKKSMEILKNIVSNLNEKSRLFEPFLLLNSPKSLNLSSSTELLTENTAIKNIFELSMLGVETVKKHLINIIPKYILRIKIEKSKDSLLAEFDELNKCYMFNERLIFDINIFDNLDEENLDRMSISVLYLTIHEISHAKLRVNENDKITNSPIVIFDSLHNGFEPEILAEDNEGESGRITEFFITRNNENKKKLLFCYLDNLTNYKPILDYKLWIEEDFTKLEDILSKCQRRKKSVDKQNNKSLGYKYDIDSDDFEIKNCVKISRSIYNYINKNKE